MHVTEYQIVENITIRSMNAELASMIRDGWQPKDDLIVICHSDDSLRYIQVMYK